MMTETNDDITTSDELDEVLFYVDNQADLQDLKVIVQHITARRTQIASNDKLKFTVGEQVGFNAKGRVKHGTITKINRKYIKVFTTDRVMWDVFPSL